MLEAELTKKFTDKNRCSECKIRSYSFCRCLQEDKLKEFSNISIEKKFDDKSNLDMIKKIKFFGKSKKLAISLIDQI